ncbi:MAG: hypothetical protein K0R65_1118 [Crocinitomicaceae bacterium]|jgi:hypothetical protein|nr:hypothetical protein [Crocinitomicaceae bacterium]
MKITFTHTYLSRFFLLALALFAGRELFSQALPFTQTTPGTYTAAATGWLCPAGVTCVKIQVWGAGGGGGGNNDTSNGGGGGGGGGYSEGFMTVVPGTRYAYTVGAGGAGGDGAIGGAGGQTFFNTAATLFANGGGAGQEASTRTGGAGGTGGGTISTLNFSGGAGGDGRNNNKGTGGGGGSSASPIFQGSDGSDGAATGGLGATAAAGGGDGGDGGNQSTNGSAGSFPGGGGGGSGDEGVANMDGGAGGNGQIIITAATPNCPGSTAVTPSIDQSICQATATNQLTAVSTISGGCGTPTVLYQWYSNTTNSNTVAGATLIAGQTAATFTPPNGTIGTLYYFCVAYATNNGCGQTNATQSLASNPVRVSIVASTVPTVSNAGGNLTICINSSTALAANTPVAGTGTWSVVSGPSTSAAQFSNVNSPTATFTPSGVAVNGAVFTLRWTIATGSCNAPSTDDMTVTVNCGGGCPACPAPYTQPTVGIAGEYVGSCLVTTCSGIYTDDGGTGANYSNSINAIYRVFCPTNAGQCMRATFTSFDVQPAGVFYTDYLTVGNGPTQNSTVFTTAPANAVGRIYGTPAVPFSYTSTHQSGCLTMRFVSDAATTRPGWQATLECIPCAGGPSGTDNSDCVNATPTCADVANPVNAKGPGIDSEGCTGATCPAGGENHANWYRVTMATAGTLNFTVAPTTTTDDYDFAVFKNATCAQIATGVGAGAPFRCSDSGDTGNTGTSAASADVSEDVLGDKFTDDITVAAGDVYYIMVDEWTPTGSGFNLDFTLTGGATFDCTLPIDLTEFSATYSPAEKGTNLYWKTMSERDNDFFTLEKSMNGESYYEIAKIKGGGTTTNQREYYGFDPDVPFGVNYYRLKQTDFNGNSSYSEVRAVNVLPGENDVLTLVPNPTTGKTELIFNSYKKEIVYLKLMDSKGSVIMDREVDCMSGGNFYDLDLTDYNDGIYFITVTTSNRVYTEKIVKQ